MDGSKRHEKHDDDFPREGENVSKEFAESQGGELDDDTKRDTDPHGATLPTRGGRQMPRMPHERDQSAGSQSDAGDPVTSSGAQAHEDVSQGRVDTDRGPPMDELYGKELRSTDKGADEAAATRSDDKRSDEGKSPAEGAAGKPSVQRKR